MKNIKYLFFIAVIPAVLIISCTTISEKKNQDDFVFIVDTNDATNNFYDNEQTHFLPKKSIIVNGETSQTFKIDLTNLSVYSVIVKETLLSGEGNTFQGSYRYDGPSLADILDKCPLEKNNIEEFPLIIDAYIEIVNDKGDKAVFSWGEIFYPIHRNDIIIATSVMNIVPSKTKDQWSLPENSKIIVAYDLLTERNISNPVKITIKSLSKVYKINRDLWPLYSKNLKVLDNEKEIQIINDIPDNNPIMTYPNIFYGRGRGIHAVTPFDGYILKDILSASFPTNKTSLMTGMFTIASVDGYRAAFSYSEIMNRNDQSEVLLVDKGDDRGGRYRLYPSADFFSDRSIKSVSEIMYQEIK